MIGLLALAAAAVQPVEAAERAFASMAQTKGQWTAFRAFAAPDAIMLLDGPQPAAPFLKDRKDPPVAVMWWPARTVTSCDGTLAFSTGPWRRKGGQTSGRYFTIWQRQASGGWKWVYDGGVEDTAGVAAGDRTEAIRANCSEHDLIVRERGPGGQSKDFTLVWGIYQQDTGKYRLLVRYNTARGMQPAADVILG